MSRVPALAIDVRAATRERCGIGRYSVELARALADLPGAPPLLLYAASRRGRAAALAALPRELVAHPKIRCFAPWLPARLVAQLAKVPGFRTELLTGALALFHHTDLIYVEGLRCPEVVTVHDLAFEVSREFHDAGFHDRVRERMQRAIARARAVLVPSEATRADLEQRWRVDPSRISVIPLGGDHVLRIPRGERRAPVGSPLPAARGYFLHVGTIEPRKNLPRLVRAYRAARRRGLEQQLVLVGGWGWKTEELRAELARGDPSAPVLVRGSVDEPELRAWLEDAAALVYPSLYEGFGLPVAEAFHLGVAVITSARSATREVAGDAAALVDPESEAELEKALLAVGGDAVLREKLAELGRRRAPRFAWSETARATLDLDRAIGAA